MSTNYCNVYIGPVGVYDIGKTFYSKSNRLALEVVLKALPIIASEVAKNEYAGKLVDTTIQVFYSRLIGFYENRVINDYANKIGISPFEYSNNTLVFINNSIQFGNCPYSADDAYEYIHYRSEIGKLLGFGDKTPNKEQDRDYTEISEALLAKVIHGKNYYIVTPKSNIECIIFGDYVFLNYGGKCHAVHWSKVLSDLCEKYDKQILSEALDYRSTKSCSFLKPRVVNNTMNTVTF